MASIQLKTNLPGPKGLPALEKKEKFITGGIGKFNRRSGGKSKRSLGMMAKKFCIQLNNVSSKRR